MRREAYLTAEFVDEMRDRYFRGLEKIPDDGKVGVLAIDLQNHFLSEGFRAYLPSAPSLLKRLVDFYGFLRELKIPLIFTKHCHRENILAEWWGDEMLCESSETELHGDLGDFVNLVVEKNTYDAFYRTELEGILRKREIKTIIITGVTTHLCCETTAREAFVRGFHVIFPIDGTATHNRELHECSLRSMSHGFAVTPTLEEVKRWLTMRKSE